MVEAMSFVIGNAANDVKPQMIAGFFASLSSEDSELLRSIFNASGASKRIAEGMHQAKGSRKAGWISGPSLWREGGYSNDKVRGT